MNRGKIIRDLRRIRRDNKGRYLKLGPCNYMSLDGKQYSINYDKHNKLKVKRIK